MTETEWTATGETQLVEGEQLAAIDQRLGQAESAAIRSGSHLWVATVVFRMDPQRVLDGDSPMLDAETMLCSPQVGCFVCEQPFERRLLHRRCTGVPRR